MKCPAASFCWLLSIAFLFFCQPAVAELAFTDVPLFQFRFRVTSVNHQPPTGAFALGMRKEFRAKAYDDGWSDWKAYGPAQVTLSAKRSPNVHLKHFPFIVKLRMNKVPAVTTLDVEIKLKETSHLVKTHAELWGPGLGLALWRDSSKQPMVGTLADYNRSMIWRGVPEPSAAKPKSPRRLLIIDRFIGGSDDAIEWREGVANLARYGANTMLLGGRSPVMAVARQEGMNRVAGAVYSPPGYAFEFPYLKYNMRKGADASIQSTTQVLDGWATGLATPYTGAGYALKDVALYHLADEPGWYYPRAIDDLVANPAAMVRFHDYLQSHHLQPLDFGATSWQTIKPIGVSQATDPPHRKLFYWTTQFFPWDSAKHFAASTRAMDRAFYPGVPDPVNWNFFSGRSYVPGPVAHNPAKASPDAAMGGHDWFEFAKLHGSNMLWTEDWFGDNRAYDWSFYAAKLGPAARGAGISWGGYVVPRSSGDTEQGMMQKVLSIFGNGGKAVEYFVFGPEYDFPGNCYSLRANVILPRMATVAHMVAAAENMLWPGRKPQTKVAILQPRSSEVWDPNGISDATNTNFNRRTVDYMAETYDLYRGLQQQNIPADFVAEDALTPSDLKGYKVLFVTEPDFPQEGIPGLLDWVRRGGILVSVSGALAADRYDVPMSDFQQASGIVESPRKRQMIADASLLTAVDSLDDGWPVYGARGSIREFKGTVLAHFKDGTPAIVQRKLDRGDFIHFAFMPGISAYVGLAGILHDLTPDTSGPPGGIENTYSATALKWIAYPARQAGVQLPVTVDQLDVETPLLLSSHGAVVTLLNWRGKDLSKLQVTVNLPFRVRTVESVTKGKLPFTRKVNTIFFSMPLAGADIVMLKK